MIKKSKLLYSSILLFLFQSTLSMDHGPLPTPGKKHKLDNCPNQEEIYDDAKKKNSDFRNLIKEGNLPNLDNFLQQNPEEIKKELFGGLPLEVANEFHGKNSVVAVLLTFYEAQQPNSKEKENENSYNYPHSCNLLRKFDDFAPINSASIEQEIKKMKIKE